MGAIWFDPKRLATFLSEILGYKSGLALNKEQITDLLNDKVNFLNLVNDNEKSSVRIRSEEIEDLVEGLLFKLGNTPKPKIESVTDLMIKYSNDPEKNKIFQSVLSAFMQLLSTGTPGKPIDPTRAMLEIFSEHGQVGVNLFSEITSAYDQSSHSSPWLSYRTVDWEDIIELDELFKSESMKVSYGEYIDQRFIDYLYQNFPDIDKIHWRKFEQLIAEYFHKNEWGVEIGPGRDDDGVDIRISKIKKDEGSPEVILIQCKRQKKKIEKVIVKALWADVVNESANSGLIVTTSALSPGAKKICNARSYNINEADRETLKKWLQEMRTPGKGFFIAE